MASGQLAVYEDIPKDLLELAGVDDAHVQARANRVIKEGGVDRLTHPVVAAERKREV